MSERVKTVNHCNDCGKFWGVNDPDAIHTCSPVMGKRAGTVAFDGFAEDEPSERTTARSILNEQPATAEQLSIDADWWRGLAKKKRERKAMYLRAAAALEEKVERMKYPAALEADARRFRFLASVDLSAPTFNDLWQHWENTGDLRADIDRIMARHEAQSNV